MTSIERFKEISHILEEKAKTDDVFREHVTLIEEWYNLYEKCKDYVKRKGESIGPFHLERAHKISYNANILKDVIPAEIYAQVVEVTVNKKALDLALERGQIKEDVIQVAKNDKEELRVRGPQDVLEKLSNI